MKLRMFSRGCYEGEITKYLFVAIMFFCLSQPAHALFSRSFACEISDLNNNSLVKRLPCSELSVAEVSGSTECLGVFKYDSENQIYKKTSHFAVVDGLGCGSVHISRTGKYIAVVDALNGREGDEPGLRIYNATGLLIGSWGLQTFLSAEELDYELNVRDGFLWFDSGSFNDEKEEFTFIGPAKVYKTDTGIRRAVRRSVKIKTYMFTIDLVKKTISRR